MALLVRLRQAARGLTLRALLPLMVKRQALPDLLRSLDRPAGPTTDDPRRLAARLFRPLHLWPTTCLYRALGSYALLRAAGQEVRFVIGVRKANGELQAHAWLERDGQTIVGAPGPDAPYTVAYAWPADPAPQRNTPGERGPGLTPSDEVLLTELKDGTGVLLHVGSKFYFTLNRTGLMAWKLIAAGGAPDAAAVARTIAAAFPEADPAAVSADVAALVTELTSEGLLAPPA